MRSTTNDPPVRRLSTADLPDVVRLRAVAAAGLPGGFLWPKTEDQLGAYLDGTAGAAFGIDGGRDLAAMALLRVPGDDPPSPHPRFPLVPDEDWPRRACGLESTVVSPEARGRGYQRALIDARLAHAASTRMRWACAGVRLENAVSWANLLARGMVIVGVRFDSGYPILGLLRPLGPQALRSEPNDRVAVGADDPSGHQAALGGGYVGVRLAGDRLVIYERLSPPRTPRSS